MKTKLKEEYRNKTVKGRIGGGMSFSNLILSTMRYKGKILFSDPKKDYK